MSPAMASYPTTFPKRLETQNPSIGIKLLAPLLISTAGTGGLMTVRSFTDCNRLYYNLPNKPSYIDSSTNQKTDTRSPAEHVANIRDGFAVSMSDLATILGITRPTAYAWLRGDEPKPEAVTKIQRLSKIADRVKSMNISRLDKLVHRPLSDGRSLFDVLQVDADPIEVLASLQAIDAKEAQTRRESKSSAKHLRSLDAVLSESSVPIDL